MIFFSRKKLKLVVSDFHLGEGRTLPDGEKNYWEDFKSDSDFIDFLGFYSAGEFEKAEIELIINGDFFNHLQVIPDDSDPEYFTEGESLRRTVRILRGHPEIFEVLSAFSRSPRHAVTFIIGNHEPGLLWESVQKEIKTFLKGEVRFFLNPYRFDGVHVEHGNQYMAENRYDPACYFLTEGLSEPIVHLPWGSFFSIHYLNSIKKERPYVDKVYPFRAYLGWALFHDTFFALKAIFKLVAYLIRFSFKRSPAHRFSLKQRLAIVKEATVHPKLHREAKRILLSNPEIHTVVFGHTHQSAHRIFGPGKEYFNTGTWVERISLDVGSLGRSLRLTFVMIEYDKEGNSSASLKEWKGLHPVVEDVD